MERRSITIVSALLLIATVLGASCRSVRRGEPITGLLPTANAQLARGEKVFQKHCHQCHPGGEGGLGPGLNDKPAPVFLMKTQVRLGLGAMPGFGKEEISPEDLEDLMAYVVTLRKAD